MDNSFTWNIIQSFFQDDPQSLVRHHIESYNDFFTSGIYKIFKEKNPIRIQTNYDENLFKYDDTLQKLNPDLGLGEYRTQALLYFGGKDGSRVYFGKPVIYDEDRAHYMYPNEARLRNMTYGMTIHYDIEIEYINILNTGESPEIVLDETVGGDGALIDSDYDEENPGDDYNFKEKDAATTADGGNGDSSETVIGGAPKPVKQTVRKQRATTAAKILRQKTPAEIAKIRELTTKSMVSENIQKTTSILEKIYLGKFPIMVQSDFCILGGLSKDVRFQMGECKNDIGGYFIIDGKEKVVIPQEKFADNMLYIKKDTNDLYLYSAEIRSVSENVSKPIRTLSVKILAPTPSYSNLNIVVNIPNVRKPVPLFIVFRALGILSDKDIITMCLYDLEKYSHMLDLFIPSIHESGGIMTQQTALDFIAVLTKEKTTAMVLYILSDYFLPHIGETNFIQKAYYLGHIVHKLLNVYMGIENETNRDNFKFKRIETPGSLISDLFREYYNIQQKAVHLSLESTLYYNQQEYENNLPQLILDKKSMFEDKDHRQVDSGFKKAFKGNWGAKTHTKRVGVVQDMNRLSHNTMLSHLRKTNLPLDSSVKLVGPRVLHASQWGFFDPIDTPDGANIGLHKHLSISSYITKGFSREPLIKWLREKVKLKFVEECPIVLIAQYTKVFVNGFWAGMVEDPVHCTSYMKLFRRNALLPIYTSVSFDIKQNTIFIYTDEGRLTRPIFYRDSVGPTQTDAAELDGGGASDESGAAGFFFASEKNPIRRQIASGDFTWQQLITGFNEKKATAEFHPKKLKIYELYDLYEGVDKEINPAKLDRFLTKKAVIDYVDTSESEDIYIAVNKEVLQQKTEKYTHMEIHESLIFGMMCNLIPFPHNNPATRNSFSCGQSKQAVSMYHTNFHVRMDKSAVVLASPQIPLIKTRYMDVINGEENCYGENAIVAIMCYTGYNVEDAVLINEGSLKRGLLRTTYYSTYETHEEKTKNSRDVLETETLFTNIEKSENIIGTKPGFEYNYLDEYGIIKEGTELHDKMVVIGMSSLIEPKSALRVDASKVPKKGQLGIVDKTFITEGEEGERIAKVRVREIRIPAIGDKMASRAGQKGTIGNIIPESNMPFTRDGLRPDIIINPHAIPSRMTIGQFVECITGKACSMLGCFGDATAFSTMKAGELSDALVRSGYHSSGNEVLYNGMTGEQLEAEIFMGPTYYMRLKHMVKDKINYRARGPMTSLTKQPVSGRANDGGLRIGEMERDSIIAHGATNFLTESMMERGDKYYMAVCNQTGMLAIYNPEQNLFLSPMADGPIQFVGSVAEGNVNVENITKHGRSFSVVRIPYTFKLLMQEMMCANVAMRILTDDNIEQIENLSFSSGVESKEIVENIRTLLRTENTEKEKKMVRQIRDEMTLESPAAAAGVVAAPMVDEFGRFIPTSPNTPPPPEMFVPRSPSGTPPPLSPVYTTDTPLQLSPYDEFGREGEYPSPEYATTEPAIMGGGVGGYQQGALVCRRGVSPTDTNNVWQVKNAGPEFTTIVRHGDSGSGSISGAFGGEEILVVDNNEIFPYQGHSAQTYPHYPQYPADPFLTENLLAREQPMANPYKPPDVNVVVVTGDKNELNGMPVSSGSSSTNTNSSQSPIQGGSNTISTVSQSESQSYPDKKENISVPAPKKEAGMLDFLTGGFLIKKTG